MTPRKILLERVPVKKDAQGRVIERFFDRYGEPRFSPNTPKANRRALALIRTKPSSKPEGGYRVPVKDRPKRERVSE